MTKKCASDLKQVSTFEEELFMSLMFANYELCFLGDSTQAQRKDMPTQFSKLFSELRLQQNTMMLSYELDSYKNMRCSLLSGKKEMKRTLKLLTN